MARKIVMVILILACLGAAAVILVPKLDGRAELRLRENTDTERLAASLAFIGALAVTEDDRETLRARAEKAHEDAFGVAYDPDGAPAFNEAYYMHLFTYDLYLVAVANDAPRLADYLKSVHREHRAR